MFVGKPLHVIGRTSLVSIKLLLSQLQTAILPMSEMEKQQESCRQL